MNTQAYSNRTRGRSGFTLVELLTVIAIIALLIGILTPAVVQARIKAKDVAVMAQLDTISKALETFNSDFGFYPESESEGSRNPGDDDEGPITGAHRLAFALAGIDQLGCPSRAGGDVVPGAPGDARERVDSIGATYYSDDGSFDADENSTDIDDEMTPRKGPYIESDAVRIWRDKAVQYANLYENSDGDPLGLPMFVDKWDNEENMDNTDRRTVYRDRSPILYYRANDRGRKLVQRYNYYDNLAITRRNGITPDNDSGWLACGWNENSDVKPDASSLDSTDSPDFKTFYHFIWNQDVETRVTPYNPDTYLLISAGYDKLFGTDDDITNFDR